MILSDVLVAELDVTFRAAVLAERDLLHWAGAVALRATDIDDDHVTV